MCLFRGVKLVIVFFAIASNSLASKRFRTNTDTLKGKLSTHQRLCKKTPVEQSWWWFGKYKRACKEFKGGYFDTANWYFEELIIEGRTVYALEYIEDYDEIILTVLGFTSHYAFVRKRIVGGLPIKKYCEEKGLSFCNNSKIRASIKKYYDDK